MLVLFILCLYTNVLESSVLVLFILFFTWLLHPASSYSESCTRFLSSFCPNNNLAKLVSLRVTFPISPRMRSRDLNLDPPGLTPEPLYHFYPCGLLHVIILNVDFDIFTSLGKKDFYGKAMRI